MLEKILENYKITRHKRDEHHFESNGNLEFWDNDEIYKFEFQRSDFCTEITWNFEGSTNTIYSDILFDNIDFNDGIKNLFEKLNLTDIDLVTFGKFFILLVPLDNLSFDIFSETDTVQP